MEDLEFSQAEMDAALKRLPEAPAQDRRPRRRLWRQAPRTRSKS